MLCKIFYKSDYQRSGKALDQKGHAWALGPLRGGSLFWLRHHLLILPRQMLAPWWHDQVERTVGNLGWLFDFSSLQDTTLRKNWRVSRLKMWACFRKPWSEYLLLPFQTALTQSLSFLLGPAPSSVKWRPQNSTHFMGRY